jgi:hypothetical protein
MTQSGLRGGGARRVGLGLSQRVFLRNQKSAVPARKDKVRARGRSLTALLRPIAKLYNPVTNIWRRFPAAPIGDGWVGERASTGNAGRSALNLAV